MTFMTLLQDRWDSADSLICVGLDPDIDRLPAPFSRDRKGIEAFLTAIIDATQDLACAFKPQIAHFAALGAESVLVNLIRYIHSRYPDIPVILDSKRGDIGSTAEMYAREAFQRYNADAVTVNPYLGQDSIEPFTRYADKGTIVLCRTSNPSAAEIQNRESDGTPLYAAVAEMAAGPWKRNRNVSLVVGATAPEELSRVRDITGDMPLLVPGLGTQGGEPEAVLSAGLTGSGQGLVINASRSILYADSGSEFDAAARAETRRLKEQVNDIRRRLGQ